MILTYKYRLKDRRAGKRLSAHAYGVNQVWNYCNGLQQDLEARYRAGAPKRPWPSNFDLQKQVSGCSKNLGIHAQTVGAVCRQYAQSRDKAKHSLKFRVSFGANRTLGWIPFEKQSRQTEANTVTYLGNAYRWFGDRRRPLPETAKGGAFVEDARGCWWVTFHVEVPEARTDRTAEVGIDLGLKTLAVLSDGRRIENPRVLKTWAEKLAIAQRASNKNRIKAIHAKIANTRKDYLHKASSALIEDYGFIAVGDVNAFSLAKTRMAKSVLDAGWSAFRNMLRYKCQQAGVMFVEVSERGTSQMCSGCREIPDSSPKGMGALGIRAWECSNCGDVHDRDVNAARNILRLGRSVTPRVDESRELLSHGWEPDRHAFGFFQLTGN